MTTAIELLNEANQLARRICDLLDEAPIDSMGVLEVDADELMELQLLQETNKDNCIQKLEGLMFAIRQKQAEVEYYQQTIRDYQAKKRQVENSIKYLESLAINVVQTYGKDNKLATPTFPKLKVRTYGKGKVVPNDEYSDQIPIEWLKPHQPTLKDLDVEYARKQAELGNIPMDEDGNPMFTITQPVLRVSTH